jgi:hypothetical protein
MDVWTPTTVTLERHAHKTPYASTNCTLKPQTRAIGTIPRTETSSNVFPASEIDFIPFKKKNVPCATPKTEIMTAVA